MDNLCQFLAQDRVQSFAAMKPDEILFKTEQSVGDGSLFDLHQDLIKLGQSDKSSGKVWRSTPNQCVQGRGFTAFAFFEGH